MNLENSYYYYKGALSKRFCNQIVQYVKSKQELMGTTGAFDNRILNTQEIKDLKKERDSNIVWLNESWIYRMILPFVKNANEKANWNFKIDGVEKIQFTKYNKNQFYHWHCDSFPKPNKQGKIRKLSVTCSLSNPSEYKGGELEFDLRNDNLKSTKRKCTEIMTQGSIVVFPSFMWHRVKPVTKGIRHSLVLWNTGDSFK
jgi:PKHD-type hydroxylase|tara:strand:+ start:1819 stop:2418 length:600 start_codon:yes stop_codon:yes gene_type:complete